MDFVKQFLDRFDRGNEFKVIKTEHGYCVQDHNGKFACMCYGGDSWHIVYETNKFGQ